MKQKSAHKSSKIALFLGIFFLFNSALSRLYLEKKLSDSRTGFIDKEFQQYEKKIEVLAMGDSHPATGFDPRVFKNAFNFALYGEKYIYNYYKLKYILERNPQIKVIILPIDLHSFSTWQFNRFLHDFYWVKYVDYLELGWYKKDLLRFIGKYIGGKIFPYLGEYEILFDMPLRDSKILKVPQPEIFQGFIRRTARFDKKREQKARARALLHFQRQRYFDELEALYFEKILDLCALFNKNLVLVKYPVSQVYFRCASEKVPVKKLYGRVGEIIKPYRNVRVLDYQRLFFENDGPYFADPDHLNQHGADRLSRRIREDLLRLNIISE